MTSVDAFARALEAKGLEDVCLGARASQHHLKPTEGYPPNPVATILQAITEHVRKTEGVPINAIEVAIGPHIDDDTHDVRGGSKT